MKEFTHEIKIGGHNILERNRTEEEIGDANEIYIGYA